MATGLIMKDLRQEHLLHLDSEFNHIPPLRYGMTNKRAGSGIRRFFCFATE